MAPIRPAAADTIWRIGENTVLPMPLLALTIPDTVDTVLEGSSGVMVPMMIP